MLTYLPFLFHRLGPTDLTWEEKNPVNYVFERNEASKLLMQGKKEVPLLERLNGRTIKSTREEEVKEGKVLVLELDDGSELRFGLEGDIGADFNWYSYAIVRLNGKRFWRDAN